MNSVSWISQVGAVELAFGALTGWIVWIALDTSWLKKVGVRTPRRILQAHIDLIMMGTILIAVGAAAPDFPKPWSILLVVGAWTNPLLFVPGAFYRKKPTFWWSNLGQAASFVVTCTGMVAFAVYMLQQ